MITVPETTERLGIAEVVNDILARHRDGSLTDLSARRALVAFITSFAPDDFLDATDLTGFDVYLDITLQISKRTTSSWDSALADRTDIIAGIALGQDTARNIVRAVAA